ncbi:MAG TPA: hypothetical protein ENI87_08340 [bacterium]|nr:hypothetical protein [bacterium]
MRPLRAAAAALLCGFGVMAAELTAVRLLAPHFGDSAYVWTNVIGAILAAMAVGAALGGRLAGRANAERWPFRALLAAATLLLVAPWLTGWLGDALLPADLPLDAAMPVLIRASLVAAMLVFAPPLLLLAMVTPLLVVLVARSGIPLGRAAGDVAAAGTAGSLMGTFAATHWLVPGFGCRMAMAFAALGLLVAALLVAPVRQRANAGIALLVAALVPWLHRGPLRAPAQGHRLLAERETPYQYLQVVRSEAPPERTALLINEGLDSFHSLAIEGSCFTDGAYYDWHAIAPLLAGDGTRPRELRALSIGDAAGTLRAVYAAVHPGVPVDAVDLDAETMALGDAFFPGPKATGERFALDGRVFLERAVRRWHVIHVDAYAHQVYVPAHLASREFFTAAYDRLVDGGILACNVGAIDLDDAVLRAIATTLGSVFDEVRVLLVPRSRNALLVARRGRAIRPTTLRGEPPAMRAGTRAADRERWQQMLTLCADPAAWHQIEPWSHELRDDRPELDELLFDSYVDDEDPRRIVNGAGSRGLHDVEQAAHSAYSAGDYAEVIALASQARELSAYMRWLLGNARWSLRHLHSAALEYRAGLAIAGDGDLRQRLGRQLAALETERKPLLAAEQAAARNGWLATSGALLAAALWIVLLRRA